MPWDIARLISTTGVGRSAFYPNHTDKRRRDISGGAQFSYTSVDKDQETAHRRLQLARVNTTIFKDWLDSKLRVPQEDMGAWHINDDAPEDYRLQMTSNIVMKWRVAGRSHRLANHYWDCEVLALARRRPCILTRAQQITKTAILSRSFGPREGW